MTAAVTTCWWQKNKKGNVFEDTGDTRTGCLVLLHADRLAATDEPATTDVARLDELFAAPSVNLQLQRCPYYHFDSFKRHHYLTEGINKSCWSWELRLHGRPIGFHSVNAALGMPGAGEGTSGGSREHRVVILPDFQGIGLGWMLAETVAAQLTSTGRRYTSITMHPTYGACRDRSERWRPNARNHKADKDEATTDVRGRSLAQKAGTSAPTTRDKLRPSYRHEYVGDPGAERETILANLSDTIPPHNCKPVGCCHCTTNRAEFQKKLDLYKLSPTNELKGTCWVKGGPPALAVPRPPVSTLKREDRHVTKRLEAVTVEGGRGPRSKKDVLAEKRAKKDADLLHREAVKKFDTPTEFEGDWTKKEGKWVVPKEDREDFSTDGPLIGTKVWRNVDGTVLEGEVIGVGALLIHEDDEDKVACVRVVYENGFQQDLYHYAGDDEFGAARDAFVRWEAFKRRDASSEEVEGGNWTRGDDGKWTPSAQDEGAFLLEGERIGDLVRTNVTLHNGDDVPCDGVVIGVGRVQAEDGTYQACTRVTYKPPEGVDAIDIQEDLWETEFQVAWKASRKWEKKLKRAARGGGYDAGGSHSRDGSPRSRRPGHDKTDGAFLPGDRVEVVGQGGGVITTVSNPVPQRSRRRTAEVYGKAETGLAPTMYSVVFDTGPAAGKSATLTLDQLLRGVPKCWSAQKRRRRRGGGDEDEVVLDDRDDDEDMVDEFGGLFEVALQKGERVEVRQRKGRKEEVWVLGRVKASSAVGYDVVLDDGRVETCAVRSVRPADEDGLHLFPSKKKKRPKPAAAPKPPKRRLSAFAADFFAVGADVDALFGMDLSVIRRVCVLRARCLCVVSVVARLRWSRRAGARWYRGTVDDLVKDGAGKLKSYEIRWPSNDDCNRIAPKKVRPHERGTPDG